MAYVVFGGLLTILELYRLVLHRTHTFEVLPVLRIGIPLLLRRLLARPRSMARCRPDGILLRPHPESRAVARGSIGIGLNLFSTLSLVWVGFSLRKEPTRLRELWLAVAVTLSAFAAGWILQTVW